MKVTKDTTIAEVLRMNRNTAQFFFEIGMHCIGCPSASGESLEEACIVHGVSCDELVNKINAFLEAAE
jgi:hybrid cluster-associated redox disulfide protein